MSSISGIQTVPEFQVVLVIDYDDGRMFPLTEDLPKCLLPVANRKLLSYQLDTLHKSGAAGEYCTLKFFFFVAHVNFVITTKTKKYI